jgi:hypothetical protein
MVARLEIILTHRLVTDGGWITCTIAGAWALLVYGGQASSFPFVHAPIRIDRVSLLAVSIYDLTPCSTFSSEPSAVITRASSS